MSDHRPPPSPAELDILRILWRDQPCTVKTVHDALAVKRDVGYTTTLKQLQRMEDKGIVVREKNAGRATLYRAAEAAETVRKNAVERLLDTAFGGSVAGLVAHALGGRRFSSEEVDEIRRLVEHIETEDRER